MTPIAEKRDPYLVKSVVHASSILSAFRDNGETLTLKQIVDRCALPKTMVFRLLYTLERCSIIEKVGANLYRSTVRPFQQKICRVGYASQGSVDSFASEISSSLQLAAAAERIELISVDNRYNPRAAQRNADLLIREKVDLAIEFQTNETVALAVAAKYHEAGIPLIAVEFPHPGATYYGANNYEAGLIGGRYLARWVKENWHSELDEILLLELPRAGNLPQMRLSGALAGIHQGLPGARACPVTHLNGDGGLGPSFEAVRRHLRNSRSVRVAVAAINDASAIGALRAFEEAGRTETCVIMGHNASSEGRAQIRQPNSRMVGSVAFFPERYGADLVRVSLDLLNRRAVPPAVFVDHKLVTPHTVDQFYPNDTLTLQALN